MQRPDNGNNTFSRLSKAELDLHQHRLLPVSKAQSQVQTS